MFARCRRLLLRLLREDTGSSEVEFILLTAFVVIPLTVVLPGYLVLTFRHAYERIGWWINLPIP
jgi:Flp pilus assembly pilin Flp